MLGRHARQQMAVLAGKTKTIKAEPALLHVIKSVCRSLPGFVQSNLLSPDETRKAANWLCGIGLCIAELLNSPTINNTAKCHFDVAEGLGAIKALPTFQDRKQLNYQAPVLNGRNLLAASESHH